jgi:hypothetical protein
VFTLLGGYRPLPHSLHDGLWCNAHLYFGLGLDAEVAAAKFFTEVIERYHPHLLNKGTAPSHK